jgi:hypothetical protein
MARIPLPTDNFYKAIACMGLLLLILSFEPKYHLHRLKLDIIRVSGEVGELEAKKKWLGIDSDSYQEGVALLEKFKKWELGPIQAINPGTEEARTYTEMTGNPIEPGIAELVLNLDSPEETKARKDKGIAEMQTQLDRASQELKVTKRDLERTETSLRVRDAEFVQVDRFLKRVKVLATVCQFIAIGMIVFGFYHWWARTQRYENAILEEKSRTCNR